MEIRHSFITNGNGVFATKKYRKGDLIFILSGELYDSPTRETIHIGNNKHIYDHYGIYINHSFTPNIFIDGFCVIALLDIKENEEIMFNYNDNEINMANPFYVNDVLVEGKKI
jgi:hypothetical protein